MKLRHFSAVLALTLLASTAFGAEETVTPPKYTTPADAPVRMSPRASCPLTCTVVRVSTRCECPMGKTPINTMV